MYIKYNSKLKSFAKDLRKNSTHSEIEMWEFLKENFPDHKFLRQKPLDNFIVDFYCKQKGLVIEIDGGVHGTLIEKDLERDNLLLIKYGLKTVRFTNDEVLNDKNLLKNVLNKVLL